MVALAAADIAPVSLQVESRNDGYLRLEEFCAGLLVENDELRGENERLRGQSERLRARVKELEGKLEELRRAAKRQAAPFSRGTRTDKPRRPGRRSGDQHGRHGHRPPPEEVDESFEAPVADDAG